MSRKTKAPGGTLSLEITERRQVEKAMKESEERYRNLVENAMDVIYTVTPDGTVTSLNPAFETITGWSCSEWIGKQFASMLHPDDLPLVTAVFQEAFREGTAGALEARILTKSGEYLQMEVKSTPLTENETVIGFWGIARDITERKRAEEALQESEESYRALFENLNDAAFVADTETGRILDTNKQGEVLLGRSREEIIGMHQRELHPPEKADEYHQRFATHVQKGRAADYDGAAIRKDGSIVPVNISAAPVAIGEKQLILGLFRDITERKRLEEELRVKDNAIASSINAIAMADLEGNLKYVNDSFLKMWGYENDNEVLGKQAVQFWQSEGKASEVVKALEEKGGWVGELVAKRKDGSFFDTQISTSIAVDETGKPIRRMASFIDITERRRMEEALTESEKRFRGLANFLPLTVFEMDDKGDFTFINRQGFETFGYPTGEISEASTRLETTVEIFVPEDRDRVMKNRQSVLNGEDIGNVEYTAVRRDGSAFPVEVFYAPIIHAGKRTGLRGILIDITERKRAEKALRASEGKYRVLVENANEAIVVAQGDAVSFINPKVTELIGYSKEEITTRPFLEFIHPDDREKIVESYTRRLAGDEPPASLSLRVIDKRGNTRWVEVNSGLITWEGSPAVLALLIDITERKQAEEALKEAEELYLAMANNPHVGFYIIQDGKYVFVNQRFQEGTGYTEAELLGMDPSVTVHPDDREMAREKTISMLKGELGTPFECRSIIKDGGTKVIIQTAMSVQYKGKRAHLGCYMDITERKQAEELYNTLANSSPVGVYIVQDGKCHFANAQFQKYTSYTKDELLSMDPLSIVHPEDKESVRENAVEMLKGNRLSPYEFRFISKGGEAIWAMETVTSIHYEGKRATLGNFMDITERKQAEQEIREKNEQLDAQNEELQSQAEELMSQQEELVEKTREVERANRLKSEFLSGMSHELRTPLNVIIGFSELMVDEVPGKINEKQRQCLDDILGSSRHLLNLINGVLDLSRIESGKVELKLENIALTGVIESLTRAMMPVLAPRKQSLDAEIEERLPLVYADEVKLGQVLLNLVDNSSKFTPDGGKLKIEAVREGDWCRVSVVDNGLGIREEDQERIFEPFCQLDNPLVQERGGTGLGLALVRQIVERYGGRIWVESEPGRGSRFNFTLPLATSSKPNPEGING